MSRLRYNNDFGTLGAALTSTGVTITFAVAPNFATIVSPDFIPIVLDASTSTFEVVYLTAYTAAALTGTITRAAEDATHWPAVAHLDGGTWGVNPTTDDYGDSALSAPLQLPATPGSPLTTQGGVTLDNGAGAMSFTNSGGGTGSYLVNSSSGIGIRVDNTSTGTGFVATTQGTGTGPMFLLTDGGTTLWQVAATGITSTKGTATSAITSGALPTIALVSGTAAQVDVSRDVDLTVPVTFNPTATVTATCAVALSADNVTYTTTVTESEPQGIASGRIRGIKVHVPAGWYVKLTVVNATMATATYY